jgi:GT2 family glycosyltransferase
LTSGGCGPTEPAESSIAAVSQPLVSVVVPTHNRPARLARLLASLRSQSLPADEFEVVVVDDGSDPPADAAITELESGSGPNITIVRHSLPRGAGAARNTGWRRVRAPLVAFTDDDCVAAPDWLRAGLAATAANPGAIVQGRTEPDPGDRAGGAMLSRTVRIERLGPQYETCNIFYPRELLETLGGFDEQFGLRPGGEDTDLAWRAIAAGREPVFAPDALVLHAVHRLGLRGSLHDAARWTETTRVFAEHPQARTMLYRGRFWNVWHYLLLRSALALLAPRWVRRPLVARHLLELRRRARSQGAGPWAVPFLLVYDAIELWAVARGAVRHRTFVL